MMRRLLPLLLLVLLLPPVPAESQESAVDFRYAPDEQWTIIGFPDDWQKTLVSQHGSLCYDFGPGPYARPLTEISIAAAGIKWDSSRQTLSNPKVPVLDTKFTGPAGRLELTSFALLPAETGAAETWSNGMLRRIGGVTGCAGWVAASDSVDPLFRNAAWGTNRPIRYRVKVPPRAGRLIALGFCESYKARSGMRFMDLRVEGADPRTIEPVPDGNRNVPLVFLFPGKDVDGDGWLAVEVHAAGPDPNVFLNGLWVFPPDSPVTPAEIVRGDGTRKALLTHACGTERELLARAPRVDAIVATFRSAGTGAPLRPEIHIRTRRLLLPGKPGSSTAMTSGESPYIFTSPPPASVSPTPDGWVLAYPAGTGRVEVTVAHGNHGLHRISRPPDCRAELWKTVRAWNSGSIRIPSSVRIPDPGIQFLLDASVRTLYQGREKVDGHLQFQPGPTVYRGLWIGDAVLSGIPAAMIGDPASLREMIEAGMPYQQPDGQIRILAPTISTPETPFWLCGAFWYGRATGDSLFLARYRRPLADACNWICSLRERSFDSAGAPYAGLIPPGFVDGGISTPMADYGTIWWCILALDEAIRSARHFALKEEVDRWQRTLEGFLESFHDAAHRDLQFDRFGRRYLPVGAGESAVENPQLGQFSLILPARYSRYDGRYGAFLDTLVRMNLRMLDGYLREGLVVSTGWLRDGVWPWMGGAMGLTYQRLGDPVRAREFLLAFANHASPSGVWVEEQLTREAGKRSTGDASNAEASAVFIHLARYLIAAEKGDDFEFLGGISPDWLRPGNVTEIRDGLSEFGRFSITLSVGRDGRTARIRVSPIDGRGSPGSPFCTLTVLRDSGFTRLDGTSLPDRLSWDWKSGFDLRLRRK